jgi:2-iminobutanoate/2-iminopropanoate deaminase
MDDPEVKHVNAFDHTSPYSHATVVGPWVFTKGTAGFDSVSGMFPLGIKEQTAQCMKNLAQILESCGASFADVVKANVYLVDTRDYEDVNKVYLEAMGPHRPARCCVGVAALPTRNENMKIEMIAYVKPK